MRSRMLVNNPDQRLVDRRQIAVTLCPGINDGLDHLRRDIIGHKMAYELCRDEFGAAGMCAEVLDDVCQLGLGAQAALLVAFAHDHMIAGLMALRLEMDRVAFLALLGPAVFPARHDIGQRDDVLLRISRRRRHGVKLQQLACMVLVDRRNLASFALPSAPLGVRADRFAVVEMGNHRP